MPPMHASSLILKPPIIRGAIWKTVRDVAIKVSMEC